MTPGEAAEVVRRFAACVEDAGSRDGYLYPISVLHDQPDDILHAITLTVAGSIHAGRFDDDLLNRLKTLVASIPFFVGDNEARQHNAALSPQKRDAAQSMEQMRASQAAHKFMLDARLEGTRLREHLNAAAADFLQRASQEGLRPSVSQLKKPSMWSRLFNR